MLLMPNVCCMTSLSRLQRLGSQSSEMLSDLSNGMQHSEARIQPGSSDSNSCGFCIITIAASATNETH